jgi:hypothetical protein
MTVLKGLVQRSRNSEIEMFVHFEATVRNSANCPTAHAIDARISSVDSIQFDRDRFDDSGCDSDHICDHICDHIYDHTRDSDSDSDSDSDCNCVCDSDSHSADECGCE